MNTKIWLEELALGSNFENLRAIGSNRFWCYSRVHTFKIKKYESISSNGSRNIAKSLKFSLGSNIVSLRAFGSKFSLFQFPVYTVQTKTALDYLYPFLSFSVHNFCARTDGQTFFEKVLFFPPDQEYIRLSEK